MPRTRLTQLVVASVFAIATPALVAQEVIELPAEDRILEAEFEEVYRVGSIAGNAWEQFSRVSAVGFGQSRNLHVMDDQGGRVVVVSEEGELVREFGRIGDGPGEFAGNTNTAVGFTVLRDGRTVVFDPGHSAFDVFGPDGEFDRSVRMPGSALYGMRTLLPARDGQNVITTRFSAFNMGGRPGGSEPPFRPEPSFRPVYRMVLTGDEAVQDTVIRAWQPPGDPDGFGPELVAGALPGGELVYTDSSAYVIKVATRNGELTRVLTRPFWPEPVTARIRDREIERQLEEDEERRARSNSPFAAAMAEMARERIQNMEFYHEVPVVRDLQTTWEGTIWVLRRGEEPVSDGPIDVLTPGRPLHRDARCRRDRDARRVRAGRAGRVHRARRIRRGERRGAATAGRCEVRLGLLAFLDLRQQPGIKALRCARKGNPRHYCVSLTAIDDRWFCTLARGEAGTGWIALEGDLIRHTRPAASGAGPVSPPL